MGIAGGINFYAYANDSPVDFRDPFGLKPNGCQSILCSPLLWGGLAVAAVAPEALPLEWAAGAEVAAEAAETARAAEAVENVVLFHGTDLASATDIVNNGLNFAEAVARGGGDVFWATSEQGVANVFANANAAVAEGEPAVVSTSIPQSLINAWAESGDLVIDGSTYQFSNSL
jgi:hypothetical protein